MLGTFAAAFGAATLLSAAAWSQIPPPGLGPRDLEPATPGLQILVGDGGQADHGAMSDGRLTADAMVAEDAYPVGALVVDAPWSRASAGRTGGAFMTIRNGGDRGDRLIAAESGVAARVQVHRTVMEDGVMRMRHAEDGVEVPAGGVAELKPGGFHVMLMGLAQPLQEGSSFPVTLTFERAGRVTVDVQVRAAGAMDAGIRHGH